MGGEAGLRKQPLEAASAIHMCQVGVNRLRLAGGGCFLVCHKAAGAIVRSVATRKIKHW